VHVRARPDVDFPLHYFNRFMQINVAPFATANRMAHLTIFSRASCVVLQVF
jgi:hypothetical protein